jgi:hypothetical protein
MRRFLPAAFASAAVLLFVALTAQVYNPPVAGGSGTVTSVICGNGLSGGTITTTGTCAISAALTPQGRLTLTTATPVMAADALAQTTVFYDCYAGNVVPVGATPALLTIASCEISMGLDAVTPHIASGSVYDIFGVSNAGVLALCAGPAWTSTTARGSGAGTTQIDQTVGGLWTNTVSLTHCWGGASGTTDLGAVAAHAGTYLGSVEATANGQTAMAFKPAAASGGTNNFLALYNAYNRVAYVARSRDSTASWTLSNNSVTFRAANASNSNRITYLDGLGQSVAKGYYKVLVLTASVSTGSSNNGVDFDSTSATPNNIGQENLGGTSTHSQIHADDSLISLGLHFAQAVESNQASSTSTFFGSANGQELRLEVMQ